MISTNEIPAGRGSRSTPIKNKNSPDRWAFMADLHAGAGHIPPRKLYVPKLGRWCLLIDVFFMLVLGYLVIMGGCAGIQSNRMTDNRKPQTSTTRINAAEGATVYSMTFQSLRDTGSVPWMGLFGLSSLGWLRAWLHGRRGRLGATRIIDVLHQQIQFGENEAADDKNPDPNRLQIVGSVVDQIADVGRDDDGKHDHTERWIRSLVKQNRRTRRRKADRFPGVGLRWPVVFRWPWPSAAGNGQDF